MSAADQDTGFEQGFGYDYPLIIKQLLITPLRQHPSQEIVYRDLSASRTANSANG